MSVYFCTLWFANNLKTHQDIFMQKLRYKSSINRNLFDIWFIRFYQILFIGEQKKKGLYFNKMHNAELRGTAQKQAKLRFFLSLCTPYATPLGVETWKLSCKLDLYMGSCCKRWCFENWALYAQKACQNALFICTVRRPS